MIVSFQTDITSRCKFECSNFVDETMWNRPTFCFDRHLAKDGILKIGSGLCKLQSEINRLVFLRHRVEVAEWNVMCGSKSKKVIWCCWFGLVTLILPCNINNQTFSTRDLSTTWLKLAKQQTRQREKGREETGGWKCRRHWIWSVVSELNKCSWRMRATTFVFVSAMRETGVIKHHKTNHLVSQCHRYLYTNTTEYKLPYVKAPPSDCQRTLTVPAVSRNVNRPNQCGNSRHPRVKIIDNE